MKFFKKTDVFVIVVLVVLSLTFMLIYRSVMSDRPAVAHIYYFGNLVQVVDLKQGVEKTIEITEVPGVILQQDSDGSIRFESSDCPDKVCVNTGSLSLIGESAACLPNGVLVKIMPSGERSSDEVDIIIE
ncbi:MAG: NusG domain II-containing protein [Clostridiales bacterium]|jgi:hypothetical protein|nr:NusG domain II-containing protein [Clostridiales bacterium]